MLFVAAFEAMSNLVLSTKNIEFAESLSMLVGVYRWTVVPAPFRSPYFAVDGERERPEELFFWRPGEGVIDWRGVV